MVPEEMVLPPWQRPVRDNGEQTAPPSFRMRFAKAIETALMIMWFVV